jgi:hypothetical protein
MTLSGIEAATFRFVAQHLNHCATAIHFNKILIFFVDTNILTDGEPQTQITSNEEMSI